MPNCIVLGSNSEIARELTPLMVADGWGVHGWHRKNSLPSINWDLVLVAMGSVAPVGLWHDLDENAWDECVESNLLAPIRLLRRIWPNRNMHAQVCFLAGSNPNMIMDGYSAYNVSKMGLLKAVEQLDHECPNEKFFALAPGIVLTKIHNATLDAKWPNPKLSDCMMKGVSTPIERIYGCLKWAMSQPKNVIGGRNICVSDGWDREEFLASRLALHVNLFKLRRAE